MTLEKGRMLVAHQKVIARPSRVTVTKREQPLQFSHKRCMFFNKKQAVTHQAMELAACFFEFGRFREGFIGGMWAWQEKAYE